MNTKILRTILGTYSLFFTIFTIITDFKGVFGPFLLLLLPLPLYFIIIALQQIQRFFPNSDREFVIEGYSPLSSATNLRFLFAQTSPTFLITICLFSVAVGGTIIRTFLSSR